MPRSSGYNKSTWGTSVRSRKRALARLRLAANRYAGSGTWELEEDTPSKLVLRRVDTHPSAEDTIRDLLAQALTYILII